MSSPAGASKAVFRSPRLIGYPQLDSTPPTIGDFNGDGKKDVLIPQSNAGAPQLTVLLSNGDGTFRTAVTTAVDHRRMTAAGDVNGDGKDDVAFPGGSAGSLEVFLSNGDGTFTPKTTLFASVVELFSTVALVDVNADGKVDVIADTPGSANANTLVCFLGAGDGTFAAGTILNTGRSSGGRTLATGDVDGDGKIDVTVSSGGITMILWGGGDGTFQATGASSLADGSDGIAVGDINHDGRVDVLIFRGSNDNYIGVYLNDGNRVFHQSRLPTPYGADHGAVGDLNGDGTPDIIAAGYIGSQLMVLPSNGDGTFSRPRLYISGQGTSIPYVADFDGDQKLDVLTMNSNERVFTLLKGNGDGTLQADEAYFARAETGSLYSVSQPWQTAVVDANGDGRPDVVTTIVDSGTRHLVLLLNVGGGRFGAPVQIPFPSATTLAIAAGDMNGDGRADVVVLSSTSSAPQLLTLLNNGDGTFTPGAGSSLFSGSDRIFVGDLTHDGKSDVVFGPSLIVGNGDGTFGATVALPREPVAYGDINNDGFLDFVGWRGAVFLSAANGTFIAGQDLNIDTVFGALADLNGDGKLDIVESNYGPRVTTHFGAGDGTFPTTTLQWLDQSPFPFNASVGVADFDGDGHLDFAFGTTIFFGDGTGRFRGGARYTINAWGSTPVILDADQNGAPDFLFVDTPGGTVDVFLNHVTDPGPLDSTIQSTTSKSPAVHGEPITITSRVTTLSAQLVSGAVAVLRNGTPFGLAFVGIDGQAAVTLSLNTGTTPLSIEYSGDWFFAPRSTGLAQETTKAATVFNVSVNPSSVPRGRKATITVTYSNTIINAGAPRTGQVHINVDATELDTFDIATTYFAFSKDYTILASVGSHVINVTYDGDTNYTPATASTTLVVTKPIPSVAVTATPSTTQPGATVMITVAVSSSIDPAVPTGTVTFKDGSLILGTPTLSSGTATIQSTLTTAGFHDLTAIYSGDATFASSTNIAQVKVIPPGGAVIQATATAVQSRVTVSWNSIVGATSYEVYRSSFGSRYFLRTSGLGGPPYTDFTSTSGITFLYSVVARDSDGNVVALSEPDWATLETFVDDPIQPGITVVKTAHFIQARGAVSAMHEAAGLGPMTANFNPAPGVTIRATDILDLRNALAEARSALGAPITFTDPGLPAGTPIRAIHLQEIRDAVK